MGRADKQQESMAFTKNAGEADYIPQRKRRHCSIRAGACVSQEKTIRQSAFAVRKGEEE